MAALLRAGAPADATWRGLTPIDIARRNGHGHVVRLLATRAIDAGGTSANEVTPDDAPRHIAVADAVALRRGDRIAAELSALPLRSMAAFSLSLVLFKCLT